MSLHIFESESSKSFRVMPQIRTLNKYVQRARKIAISAIDPIKLEDGKGALSIRVEGPARHISYFNQLIDRANLKIG